MADFRNQSLRARDADRVDACALLDNALAEGELTEAEHTRRTAAAMAARTFGDLDGLIDDLQIPANLVGTPLRRPQRRNDLRRWKIAIAAVCVATVVGALGGCIARTTVSKPDMPDATTGAGLASFVAAYRDHYGDATVDDVLLYPKYVLLHRRAQAGRSDYIRYDGEFHSNSDSQVGTGVETVDLSTLDLPKLAGLFAGAPRSINVPGGAITHVSIAHKTGEDTLVSIYAASGARSGHLEVSAQGEPITLSASQ
ncbi:DUF1707 SHOCT-like domain-containing protein [Nocardia acidivorans]|uniref:DUF1707 SHOCT-like domain-containing protein n=1 Tax=Nocardia acidivorans TaxID=404580 RepID=UPI00082F6AB4|nr:DUF1707 domain-containing protein [Nocardia acidivorans]